MTKESEARFAELAREALGPDATPLVLAETVASMLDAIGAILSDDESVDGALVVLKLCKGANDALIGMLRAAH